MSGLLCRVMHPLIATPHLGRRKRRVGAALRESATLMACWPTRVSRSPRGDGLHRLPRARPVSEGAGQRGLRDLLFDRGSEDVEE